jgi:predicted ABC-type ATPase
MISKLRLLLFAGPNGSGKSTFTTLENLLEFGISPDRYINADDIAHELLINLPADTTQNKLESDAFNEARNRRQIYRNGKASFAFETVFSHPSTFLDIQACSQDGFEVIVVFVTTNNSAINVERVAKRFQSGGHNVNPEKIVSRYARSMSFLPRIIEEADRTIVYDNSGNSEPRRMEFRKGHILYPQVLPLFFEEKIMEPLRNRRGENLIIQENFDKSRLPTFQELMRSQFYGRIIWGGANYIVQLTTDGHIQHDLCLFSVEEKQFISKQLPMNILKSFEVMYKDALGSFSR